MHKTVYVPQANRGNFFLRTVREAILARKVLKAAPKDVDILFVTIPSMFLLFLFSSRLAKFSILDVRDLTWEYLSDKSFTNRLAKRVFSFVAKQKISSFEFYSVTNEAERNYLMNQLDVDPKVIMLCPNGISAQQFGQVSSFSNHDVNSDTKRPTVLYVGNVGIAQNLLTLVESAKLLPDLDFLIIGSGSDVKGIDAAAKGIKNVHMRGRVEWSEIPAIYQKADILWAQLMPDFSGAVPSKLYEYLATGKPVIYGGVGEAVSVISEFDGVYIVPPDESKELVSCIRNVVSAPCGFQLSLNNRKKIEEKYIREKSVENFYNNILNGI
jgi:glycosyltransferase involved in cell wall biosynthesis